MKRLNKKGFTLVELLAVIVILAILMTIAFSVVPGLQNNAKKTGMDTELRKIVSAITKDIQLISIGEADGYSYVDTDTTDTHALTIKEGNYTIELGLNETDSAITSFCITDGSKGSEGTVNVNNIEYSDEYVDMSSCS